MSGQFDIVVVGAGPCALACLDALGKDRRIAIVTGAEAKRIGARLVHPKIQTVALEQGERPGLADRFDNNCAPGKPLFSTAIEGGLANYWGQQFVRYGEGDPYPSSVFPDYNTYLNDCVAIEHCFRLDGGGTLPPPARLPAGFFLLTPRLLTGTNDAPSAGLTAMRRAIGAASVGTRVFSSRAERIARIDGSLWSLRLSDGQTIETSKILLAAGVLGTAQLVMASFVDISTAWFSDHAPYMLYTIGVRSLHKLRPAAQARHFNALTIEKQVAGRCEMFASLYDMGAAEFNLLLASTIGLTFSFLRGWSAPPGAGLVQPVQIWTERCLTTLRIEAGMGRVIGAASEREVDPSLQDARAMLKGLGARILHCSRTVPGAGFHYHTLTMRAHGGQTQTVADLLRERTDGAVSCVDASVLPTIGVRPPTLTAMATARRLIIGDQSLR